MRFTRFTRSVLGAALVASLAACAAYPPPAAPLASYPAAYPAAAPVAAAPVGVEYGRVASIQVLQTTAAGPRNNVPGAILGAVAGALVGNAVGRSLGGVSARDTSTVVGGIGGLAVGSQLGGPPVAGAPVYRVTVQTDQGVIRVFDVPSPGDLRVGDRVRVDRGVIYHY